jgi:tRNA 5-methylaminomethyl-2-thiouridine biosynthesis bifunctional protein
MLEPAELEWRDNEPYAPRFSDIYYTGDGVDEVARVFLRPSQIAERAKAGGLLTVAELGFGSGLNFIECATCILRHPHARLHFISFEKHPLRAADWQRLSNNRRGQLFDQLAAAPPPLLPGWHRRCFQDGRITLSVMHADVADGLLELTERQQQPVDGWFLDGFAPSKNTAMWTPRLFDLMARCSAANASVATFSAAGAVRRGLEAVGFQMRRVDQQPFKRESLAGIYRGRAKPFDMRVPKRVAVYGAGIAGCSIARQLAQQDVMVSVYDPNGVAQGASRMTATVLHGRLLGDKSVDAEFRCAAYHNAIALYPALSGFEQTGVLQVQGPNLNPQKMQRIIEAYPLAADWLQIVNKEDASELAGLPIDTEALWFRHAGIVDLPLVCQTLLRHPNIEQITESGLEHLQPPYVIASATQARAFPRCDELEIVDVYGQLDWLESSHKPKVPIIGNGYVVPTTDGCAIGASYEHSPWDPALAREHNQALNAHILGDSDFQFRDFRRAPRSIASDRIPVVGKLGRDEWITTAHSSLGTASAPLGASILASRILGWVPPVSNRVERLLHPDRFSERQARRGVRHITHRSRAR